ncbi:MAG: polyketide synthase, partial [Planctomycetales bacterium]|nr:polyketide synthase [Planctomycetales bacterium]
MLAVAPGGGQVGQQDGVQRKGNGTMELSQGSARQPLALVGIGCRFPGGVRDAESFWRMLLAGESGVSLVPDDRWNWRRYFHPDPAAPNRITSRRGGFVDGLKLFDAPFWGISPREARRMDPQQRWLLEAAWEALEDAGAPPERLRGADVGVYVGISTHDYSNVQSVDASSIDVHTNSGGAFSIAANRISYQFDFRGPSVAVDTACSSALVAVSQAAHAIWAGECVAALAGGVNAVVTQHCSIGFSKASMLSPSGECFAFDSRANGYVRGEGVGLVFLKPLAAAIADGDPVYAVLKAAVVNQDGRTSSMTIPGAAAQAAMLRRAYQQA